MDEPQVGERVRVWPMPGVKITEGPTAILDGGRWLPPRGAEIVWSEWWHRRYRDGSISLHEPVRGGEVPKHRLFAAVEQPAPVEQPVAPVEQPVAPVEQPAPAEAAHAEAQPAAPVEQPAK